MRGQARLVRKPRRAPAWALLAVLLASAGPGLAGAALAAPAYEHAAAGEGLAFARAGDRLDPKPAFPEIMGGGACWLDYDADGDMDLFLVNGWYNDTALAAVHQPRSQLFRNDGPRAGPDFVDATAEAGLDVQGWTQGCSAADYDGDGLDDLLVIGYGIQRLFHNQGDRTFADASAQAGIGNAGKCGALPCWGTSAAWADYDRDGCLDLYVIDFVAYDIVLGGPRSPGRYDGQPNQLYRNQCDGTFADVTAAAGVDGQPDAHHGKDWGVTWLDYDRDGWLDLYVASDGVPNILYRNNGDGTFTDTAVQAGVADQRNGMGTAAADCDNDGFEDLFMTHYSSPPEEPSWGWDGFYVNNGNGTFTDHSGEGDLAVTEPWVKWGLDWADLDNDGTLDLHVATGHTESVNASHLEDQPGLLWTGDGACHWTDARATAGAAFATRRMSRGTAHADFDLDGVLDIVEVNLLDESAELLRGTASQGHWLDLELRQPGGNRRAVGAEVRVELPGGLVLHRRAMPDHGIHGNHAPLVHLGLGAATTATVTVTWPEDRATTRFEDLPADRIVRLERGGGTTDDTLAPSTALGLTGEPGQAGWRRGAVVASLEASDRAAGSAGPRGVAHAFLALDGGAEVADPAPLALAEGPHLLRWRSVDLAGNAELARSAFVGVDNGAPASAATLAGDLQAGAYRGPVNVTLSCADPLSGPAGLAWRLDAGAWQAYAGPFDLAWPGAHTLGWRCTDRAGNAEPEQSLAYVQDLGHPGTAARLDGPPGLGGWWRGPVTVTLEASAGPGEAVAETLVGLDGGPLLPYAGPVAVAGDGRHVLHFRSVGASGAEEPVQTLEVAIDATPPVPGLSDEGPHVDAAWAFIVGPRHRLRASAEEALSGLARVEMAVDWEPFRAPHPVLLGEVGLHHVMVRAADLAGNAVEWERDVFFDREAPPLEVLRPEAQSVVLAEAMAVALPVNPTAARAVLVGPAVLEAGVGEDVAGAAVVRFLVDGREVGQATGDPWTWTWTRGPDAAGRFIHAVTFEVEDRVGNTGRTTFTVIATGDPAVPLDTGAAMPALVALAWVGARRRAP